MNFLFFKLTVQYNTTWDRTTRTKLQKTASKQRKTFRIVNNENTDIWEIMFRMKILKIYKLKFQVLFKPDSGRSRTSIRLDLVRTVLLKIK